MPTFICGGGSCCDVYQSVIHNIKSNYLLSIENLPHLPNFDAPDLPKEDYHRLSVAIGLSFNIDDIGIIKLEHEIEDFIPDKNTFRVAFELDSPKYSRRLPLLNAKYEK